MNVARAWSAEDVNVKSCFFVNVRNASGLNVAGGNIIGSTVDAFWAADFSNGGAFMGAVRRGRIGCAGVPKAGEEEGMTFPGVGFGSVDGLGLLAIFSIRIGASVESVYSDVWC